MADDAFEVVLTPAWGDGTLRLVDVESVREPALCGERVLVHLREFRSCETGVPEYVGRWLAGSDVSYRFDLSCGRAGRAFAEAARGAGVAMFESSARWVADGSA